MKKHIDFLLKEACPSIKYRIHKEISPLFTTDQVEELISLIFQDDLIKKFVSIQDPSGWINQDFHSENGIETAVRVLCEKGLDASHITVSKMLNQLEEREQGFDDGSLTRVGKVLDQLNLGGSQLIRAVIFAYAGIGDKALILEQVKATLGVFKYLTGVNSINSIVNEYKGKLVFKKDVKWPSIYHLRLLAYTKSWRNKENLSMVTESIKRLIDVSPIPHINGLYRSQLISPGSFCMHDFKADMTNLDAKQWMMWFHRMELLSRLGVVKSIPELNEQLDFLKSIIDDYSRVFSKKYTHFYFTKWTMYTGLALEPNWKTKNRYLCDLLFRSLLILHYSELKNVEE